VSGLAPKSDRAVRCVSFAPFPTPDPAAAARREIRNAELMRRMTEREIFDLGSVRVDPWDPRAASRELIDRAHRANEIAHYPVAGRDQERVQAHVDDLLRRYDANWEADSLARRILTTGGPYVDVFLKCVAAQLRGAEFPLSHGDTRLVQRAMTVGTGSQGGFAVPFVIDSTIVPTSNSNINPFRAICRVEQITTNTWSNPTCAGMSAAYATEGATAGDNAPSLAEPLFTVQRAQGFAPVSVELAEDWAGMLANLGRLIQEAKDDLEAVQFTTGTGTPPAPTGLITAGTAVTGTAGFLVADLYTTETALPARFRKQAVWMGNRARTRRSASLRFPRAALRSSSMSLADRPRSSAIRPSKTAR
jgi:HK97 family phage major capsid protein